MPEKFEPVIGLEVHMQLATERKLFCRCQNGNFGEAANAHLCPTCAGLPGALPRTNPEAAPLAVRLALALGSKINPESFFERKSYFYPDLPAGFQTTQGAIPVAEGGALEVFVPGEGVRKFEIHHFHLENDAGKNTHDPSGALVDLNRAGSPLIELVTEPVFRSSGEAVAFFRELQKVIQTLGVSRANMERGELRGEANISVRLAGTEIFGTKTEVKNLNSFKFFTDAIEFEIRRQVAVIESGGAVVQETRGWDPARGETFSQRSKENAHHYRYHPEPDLPPLRIAEDLIKNEKSALPELPLARAQRLAETHGIALDDAVMLTVSTQRADFFEKSAAVSGDGAATAKWLQNELLGKFSTAEPFADGSVKISAENFGELVGMVASGKISGKIGKTVLDRMLETGAAPAEIVEKEGLSGVNDPAKIREILDAVLAENPAQAEAFKNGDDRLRGWLVGQIMARTGGRADPAVTQKIIGELRG